MSKNRLTERKAAVESLAAELTSAAYPVLLRGGVGGSWVELQLGLWKTVAETVGKWERERPPHLSPAEFANWQKGLVARLTDRAVSVACEQRVQEPPLQVKSELRVAFCSAIAGPPANQPVGAFRS